MKTADKSDNSYKLHHENHEKLNSGIYSRRKKLSKDESSERHRR